jgi:anti-anti-sigma regulatory factor
MVRKAGVMPGSDDFGADLHEVFAPEPPTRDQSDDRAVVVLRLAEQHDLASEHGLTTRLSSQLDASGTGEVDVVVDVRELPVLLAAGIRALVAMDERLFAAGKRLFVVAGARHRRALEVSPARGALTVFDTVDAAMGAGRGQTRPAEDYGADGADATPPVRVLSEVARTFAAEPGVDATLRAIASAATALIPGVEHAGISLVERGEVRTVAPTAAVVVEIDKAQYRLAEGPCVAAIADHHTYRTGDLAAESRWPSFGPIAAEHGIRSMLSYRLFASDTTMGALNLYSSAVDAFSERTEQDGHQFAAHAAVALISAQKEANLTAAIEHRDTIGTAKGILMERHGIDRTQAFRMLADASQHANLKLFHVAEWLIDNPDVT